MFCFQLLLKPPLQLLIKFHSIQKVNEISHIKELKNLCAAEKKIKNLTLRLSENCIQPR
jgi:hypothetical protein